MSSDLNGVQGLRGTAVPPHSLANVVGPSRAVVRVTPAVSSPGMAGGQPWSRSGVALEALLRDEDLLEQRQDVRQGATAMGLSQARGALLRQLPGDALAALDDVWSGAQRSEEGWYLRAGALTVLGLPGEGDRVATDGLTQRPHSVALRYLQAVARSLTGDWQGARAALTEALEASPGNAVLRLQQAVVLGRQGRMADAHALLAEVQQHDPQHPAVPWARGVLRGLTADYARGEARQTTRMASGEFTVVDEEGFTPWLDASHAGGPYARQQGQADDGVEGTFIENLGRWRAAGGGDRLEEAFRALGERLAQRLTRPSTVLPTEDLRELLRALSTGGTLLGTCSPDQAHAARTLLGQLLESFRQLGGITTARPTPSVGLVALVAALSRADHAEAGRLWRRTSLAVPPEARSLMQALLDGARAAPRTMGGNAHAGTRINASAQGRTDGMAEPASDGAPGGMPAGPSVSAIVRNERDDGALPPVRFGLSLLRESADGGRCEVGDDAMGSVTGWNGGRVTPYGPAEALVEVRRSAGSVGETEGRVALSRVETTGTGWGEARAMSGLVGAEARRAQPHGGRDDGHWPRLAAVLCVVLAAGASVLGANAAAIALAAGAVWLGMRRSTTGRRRN